jgi:hypothetical protein
VIFEIFEEANWAGVVRDADVSAGKRHQSMSQLMWRMNKDEKGGGESVVWSNDAIGYCCAECAKLIFEICEEANWAGVVLDAEVSASK